MVSSKLASLGAFCFRLLVPALPGGIRTRRVPIRPWSRAHLADYCRHALRADNRQGTKDEGQMTNHGGRCARRRVTQIPPSPLSTTRNVDSKRSSTLRFAGYLSYDRTRMRPIRELSEHELPLRRGFVSIRLLRNGNCHPNATPGVLPNPFSKCPSTIRRKFNAGRGIRTQTLVPRRGSSVPSV